MGPGRSGRAYRRVRVAATPKGPEHVRVMRRQDPLFHLLPAFAFGTKALVNRSFSGSFFLMTLRV